ncbi:CBS domain-containing protein [Actinomadura parmotrematis]|uniref:CBS domain-containing protein n=1 Tax=Actinomadura parmotrematis TaxID=2864039 RepID=A0ABS7FQE9_9ACTN|nr:CBS domain-containing protein [Actinomadura parmotrematis]MBW8482628.1 hypothetical protein [Actinomadura parmotrematis]
MTDGTSDAHRPAPPAATVADAMIRSPKVHGPATTVAEARAALANEHVHAVLIVDGAAPAATLVAVVERPDLDARPPHDAARRAGTLHGRTVPPGADLDIIRQAMTAARRRRLAVTDPDGRLLGLLCLKRTGLGFCSEAGIRARAADRAAARAR